MDAEKMTGSAGRGDRSMSSRAGPAATACLFVTGQANEAGRCRSSGGTHDDRGVRSRSSQVVERRDDDDWLSLMIQWPSPILTLEVLEPYVLPGRARVPLRRYSQCVRSRLKKQRNNGRFRFYLVLFPWDMRCDRPRCLDLPARKRSRESHPEARVGFGRTARWR
jgi:hypothetical protein